MVALVVHVDDCSEMALLIELVKEVKTELQKAFEISDLGKISWILGIVVRCD